MAPTLTSKSGFQTVPDVAGVAAAAVVIVPAPRVPAVTVGPVIGGGAGRVGSSIGIAGAEEGGSADDWTRDAVHCHAGQHRHLVGDPGERPGGGEDLLRRRLRLDIRAVRRG